jgi:hypothetical protein
MAPGSVHARLWEAVRLAAGRHSAVANGAPTRGKNPVGRTRPLLRDTVGQVWAVLVMATRISDRAGAKPLLRCVRG